MRAALIIGISDYGAKGTDLPGCAADAKAMNGLIKATGRFEKILSLTDSTTSGPLKDRMIGFFNELEHEEVEEFFFYFTGHGEFLNDEVFYLLSDYSATRRNQTSIQNSELDDLIRNLSPTLTVKVVDACQSGVQYIKEPGALQKHLNERREGLAGCYFMFSSHTSEYSYQDPKGLSHFTQAYLDSVLQHHGSTIRYKDVIDYIADAFAADPNQTPFFVVQGKNTEVFAELTEPLRKAVSACMPSRGLRESSKGDEAVEARPRGLVEIIKAESSHYCTEERLKAVLDSLQKIIPEHQFSGDVRELYEIKVNFLQERPEYLPDTSAIGTWLTESGANYFAEPETKIETYQERVRDPFAGLAFGLSVKKETETKTVTRKRSVVTGYKLTQEVGYELVEIEFEPKFQNLQPYCAFIAPVFSKLSLRFFLRVCPLKESSWTSRIVGGSSKWSTDSSEYHDDGEVARWVGGILHRIETQIMEPLRARYLGTDETKGDEEPNESKSKEG